VNHFWIHLLSRRPAALARILALALVVTIATFAAAHAAEQSGASGAVKAFVGEGWA
jgi:hypothetical protein